MVASRLMRDEHGNRHRCQHVSCCTSEYEFAKPRMPITAHYDHVRRTFRYPRYYDIGHVDIGGWEGYYLNLDTVTNKVTANFNAMEIQAARCLLVGDDEQFHGARI